MQLRHSVRLISKSRALDDFGVEYIELTSPASSEQSKRDCKIISQLGLKAKILTHVRCNMDDARLAVETGVDGVDVVVRRLAMRVIMQSLIIVCHDRLALRHISENTLTTKA